MSIIISEDDDDDERERPFEGVVLCVSGLSQEARLQAMRAAAWLGGRYSPTLDAHCTHLLVPPQQPEKRYKLNHALLMQCRCNLNPLHIVTLPWLLHCLANNARLSESLFPFQSKGALSAISLYLDSHISPPLAAQVIQAASARGATFLPHCFLATHVVCEPSSIHSYLGHSSNIVTPLWVLKSTNDDSHLKRLVHISPDLARQLSSMLQDSHSALKTTSLPDEAAAIVKSHERRQQLANSAKIGVRNRRARRMQTCQTPMRPITPTTLLDSICWSISEPTSTASIYTDSFSAEAATEHRAPDYFDAKGDGCDSESSFAHLTRPLKESERSEVIFRSNFLTLLFPIDRFSEMGPSSTTFFSAAGFTCLQVLDHIYAFYQENMAVHEIQVAIHTDSRHADHLRSVYSSKETGERGYVAFKRIDFLGSRRSFEMLKRVSGDNNNNVYELLFRA